MGKKLKFVLFVLASLSTLFGCNGKAEEGRDGFLSIYAVNDYHGRISFNETTNQIGVSRLSAFLNEQKAGHEKEYLFLNAGDLWQDSYESNSNKGKCLTECFEAMNCEAMCLGNHEFDWGIETIKENKKTAKKCTYLGANIFYYDEATSTILNQAEDLASPYKIIERNGFKIGLVGIIGKNQITSITSDKWTNITFVDPLDVVTSYSDKLRCDYNCDLVFLLSHADTSDLGFNFCNKVTSISSLSNKPYIDACLTGHSHVLENKTYNNIPFLQSGNNGEFVSHIEFDLTGENPLVSKCESLAVKSEKNDPKIDKIVNKYITKSFINSRDEVIATFNNVSSISPTYAGRLLAKATYENLKYLEEEKNITITAAINNGGRDNVKIAKSGEVTRENIFNICPFTNRTYVVSVKGANIKNCIRNNKYYAPSKVKLVSDQFYYVAIIDYLLLHKDSYRKYDMFSSYDGNPLFIEEKYPDEILTSYMKGKTFESAFFRDECFSALS